MQLPEQKQKQKQKKRETRSGHRWPKGESRANGSGQCSAGPATPRIAPRTHHLFHRLTFEDDVYEVVGFSPGDAERAQHVAHGLEGQLDVVRVAQTGKHAPFHQVVAALHATAAGRRGGGAGRHEGVRGEATALLAHFVFLPCAERHILVERLLVEVGQQRLVDEFRSRHALIERPHLQLHEHEPEAAVVQSRHGDLVDHEGQLALEVRLLRRGARVIFEAGAHRLVDDGQAEVVGARSVQHAQHPVAHADVKAGLQIAQLGLRTRQLGILHTETHTREQHNKRV
jgi:hypothetical protein